VPNVGDKNEEDSKYPKGTRTVRLVKLGYHAGKIVFRKKRYSPRKMRKNDVRQTEKIEKRLHICFGTIPRFQKTSRKQAFFAIAQKTRKPSNGK
jgi:hypothetical protein